MRVAVLLKDRCQPRKCNQECIKFCPRVRAGVPETIFMGQEGKPVISEELCIGCGICINKCPFDAIRIIGLPEELDQDLTHQYGENAFRLFRLPIPRTGIATGILGPNGIGKTTALRILSGEERPNLGDYDDPPGWDKVLDNYAGTETGRYLKRVADGDLRSATKPQYVDQLPKVVKGKVRDLLESVDERGELSEWVPRLNLDNALRRDMSELSGGELQRVAIAATLMKDADVYFFDEPSSYLDIHERLRIARVIKELSEKKQVLVIEHDLALLDFLCENVHLMYGTEGAYGVVVPAKAVRHAINIYLDGFLKEENIRFRDSAIEFTEHPPRNTAAMTELLDFPAMKKDFGPFKLEVGAGTIHHAEVVGILGPNATGKTTFVKMLAGVLKPDEGKLDAEIKVSYKPQYIKTDFEGTLQELIYTETPQLYSDSFLKAEVTRPLALDALKDKKVSRLSGGELQRVAVAMCLARDAQLYLLDEPSAYLDSNQRMECAKTIRRVMEKSGRSALIVDHDVYFIDMLADSLMIFGGDPGKHGIAQGPYDLRQGMNRFLKDVDVTFRRDQETHRPRVNKPGSRLDREQRAAGEYYYAVRGEA
ncbi:MAG: ribosome biogenesis/translation initiation ATPase RLI [Euryarchaeota archaeon]|nr:ribosome biogenesis/translation initiation ATPase RLI [Euryarchaeota archaeon]